jgi:hypothetical protein
MFVSLDSFDQSFHIEELDKAFISKRSINWIEDNVHNRTVRDVIIEYGIAVSAKYIAQLSPKEYNIFMSNTDMRYSNHDIINQCIDQDNTELLNHVLSSIIDSDDYINYITILEKVCNKIRNSSVLRIINLLMRRIDKHIIAMVGGKYGSIDVVSYIHKMGIINSAAVYDAVNCKYYDLILYMIRSNYSVPFLINEICRHKERDAIFSYLIEQNAFTNRNIKSIVAKCLKDNNIMMYI